MPNRKNNINKRMAITLIFSGSMLILIAFILMRLENILGWIGTLLGILRPIFIGIAFTFVLYGPTVKIKELLEKVTKGKRFPCNGVAVLLSYILVIGILTALIWIVVPSFISSMKDFSSNFSNYLDNMQAAIDNAIIFIKDIGGGSFLDNINTDDIFNQISNVVSKLPTYIPNIMEKLGSWASGLAGFIADIGVGIAFSAYILVGRKRLKRQAKRILKTFISQTNYNRIAHYSSLIFNTFSSFVSGQLMEALILGLLCFIGMTILGFQYTVMISVIIGVTNLIPIIGPIIGTVPGAVIYLMIDPWRAVWFVVFIIILQQIDSNLIYPRVVGNSVGLPGIWILFAITVGGGLFGIVGMLIGVPVMSIVYTILREKTADAADPDIDSDDNKNNSNIIFSEVGEKTTVLITKVKSAMHSGLENMIDKVNEKVIKNEKLKKAANNLTKKNNRHKKENTENTDEIKNKNKQAEEEKAPEIAESTEAVETVETTEISDDTLKKTKENNKQ